MKGHKLVAVGLALGVLTACGGGSSSDDSVTISVPKGNVTGKLVYGTRCGEVPAKNIAVLVHDKEGNIIYTSRNEADGEFSVMWTSSSSHMSFIDDDINQRKLIIRSFLNVEAGDLGAISLRESVRNSQCDCVNGEFNTTEIDALYPNTSLAPESSFYACKIEGKYPLINIALVSNQSGVAPVAASIDLNKLDDVGNIELTAEDFSGNDHIGKLLTLNGVKSDDKFTSGNTNVMKGLDERFSWSSGTEAYSFSSLVEDEFLSTSYFSSLQVPNSGTVSYVSSHTQALTDGKFDYQVETHRNSLQILQALQPVMEGLSVEQATNYDFTQLGQQVSAAVFEFDSSNWNWSTEGPSSGAFPVLKFPNYIVDKVALLNSNGSFSLTLGGAKSVPTYQNYRAEWAKASRGGSLLPNTSFSTLRVSSVR